MSEIKCFHFCAPAKMKVYMVYSEIDSTKYDDEISAIRECLKENELECETSEEHTPGKLELENKADAVQTCDKLLLMLTPSSDNTTFESIKGVEKTLAEHRLGVHILVLKQNESDAHQQLPGCLGCLPKLNWDGSSECKMELVKQLKGRKLYPSCVHMSFKVIRQHFKPQQYFLLIYKNAVFHSKATIRQSM